VTLKGIKMKFADKSEVCGNDSEVGLMVKRDSREVETTVKRERRSS